MITSIIMSYLVYALIPVLLLAAIASYVYIPIIGRYMAICLVASASALGAYELGYADRGKLDLSAQLQINVATLQTELDAARKDAETSKKIADNAAARELNSQLAADQANQKVTAYEAQLQKDTPITEVHKAGSCPSLCGLSAGDVAGLRAIGAGSGATTSRRAAKPAK